ncbi:hypothetical protein ACJX0J_040140, partial [Zea mays]
KAFFFLPAIVVSWGEESKPHASLFARQAAQGSGGASLGTRKHKPHALETYPGFKLLFPPCNMHWKNNLSGCFIPRILLHENFRQNILAQKDSHFAL